MQYSKEHVLQIVFIQEGGGWEIRQCIIQQKKDGVEEKRFSQRWGQNVRVNVCMRAECVCEYLH